MWPRFGVELPPTRFVPHRGLGQLRAEALKGLPGALCVRRALRPEWPLAQVFLGLVPLGDHSRLLRARSGAARSGGVPRGSKSLVR